LTKETNITLTGFMGTGKTTTGHLLVARLGCSFVDVFAQQGEAAFRIAEAQLCQQLAGQNGLVIATGGGALVNTGNRGHNPS